jgi:hypothetical protein
MVFFLPGHLCRRLEVSMITYLRKAYTLPLVLCVPMVLTLLLMKAWFVPHTYPQLAVHLLAAGLVYGAGLAWAFSANRLMEFSYPPLSSTRLDVTGAVAAADNPL